MEEELDIKKQILKQDLINITKNKDFLNAQKGESWKLYLEKILKVKKPTCIYDSFLYIFVLTDIYNLTLEEKEEALTLLGFNKRS